MFNKPCVKPPHRLLFQLFLGIWHTLQPLQLLFLFQLGNSLSCPMDCLSRQMGMFQTILSSCTLCLP